MRPKQLFIPFIFLLIVQLSFPGNPIAKPVDINISSNDQSGLVGLHQVLLDLSNPFHVVVVAQNPDDLDYSTLTLCRNKLGAQLTVLFATRGENARHSPSLLSNEARAIIKTTTALNALHKLGADAYFLDLPDVDPHTTVESVLNRWDKTPALNKVIQTLRFLKPDVLITHNKINAGEGQRQALARLLLEAFDAAGDEKIKTAPESGIWQTQRLFQISDEADFDLLINLNEYDRVRGQTIKELAKSYTSSGSLPIGEKRYLKIIRSAAGERPKPNGSLLDGLTLPNKIQQSLTLPIINGKSLYELPRETLIESLTEKLAEKRAEGGLEQLKERYNANYFRLVRFRENLEHAIALAAGVKLQVQIQDRIIAQGEPLRAKIHFYNGSNYPLAMVFHAPEQLPAIDKPLTYKTSEIQSVAPQRFATQEINFPTTLETPVTLKRSENLRERNFYPTSKYAFTSPSGKTLFAFAEVNLGQMVIPLSASDSFDISPPIEMSINPPSSFVKDWSNPRGVEFLLRIRNRANQAIAGELWVVSLGLVAENYEPLSIQLGREDEETTVKLTLPLPIAKPPMFTDILIELRRARPAPPTPLATLKVPVQLSSIEVENHIRVGYIATPDSLLPMALNYLGIANEKIPLDHLNLSEHSYKNGVNINHSCLLSGKYDTIIIDAMLYSENLDLVNHNRCLLDYFKQGGNLVVLYQKPGIWNSPLNPVPVFPFSITLSNDIIESANSTIRLLNPEHPLLNKPNKISEKDFVEWSPIRARFPAKNRASEYIPLLESVDEKENSSQGLLLIGKNQSGTFIFASLDLSSQFLSFNEGAYKLLANLIAFPRYSK
ncbi:MAG: PIG-L family deacetylase [Acidobacteriota bacterium]